MTKSDMISLPHSQAIALSEVLKTLQASDKTVMNIRIMKIDRELVVTLLRPRTILKISRSGRTIYTVKKDEEVEDLLFEGDIKPEVEVEKPLVEHGESTEDIMNFSQIELIKLLFELGYTVEQVNTNMPKKSLQFMILEKLSLEIPSELSE